MSVKSHVMGWLEDDKLNEAQIAMKHRAAEADKRQQAQLAAELEANRKAAAKFAEWEAGIDARTTAADADELAAAQQRIEDAVAAAAQIGEQLSLQRTALARLEIKTAADLEGASLDELQRIARGRTVAGDELRAVGAVVGELERRHQLALAAIDAQRSAFGQLRTAGLAALADDMAAQLIVDTEDLVASMRQLVRVQLLIGDRGGNGNGRVGGLTENANRLQNVCDIYHREHKR